MNTFTCFWMSLVFKFCGPARVRGQYHGQWRPVKNL